jgi:BMFP domain-containing protein YqiC
MIDKNKLDELAARLTDAVPDGLKKSGESVKQNFHKILQSGLSKMDLVSREEFDVQAKILARTREKLTALEKTVAELEKTSDS